MSQANQSDKIGQFQSLVKKSKERINQIAKKKIAIYTNYVAVKDSDLLKQVRSKLESL